MSRFSNRTNLLRWLDRWPALAACCGLTVVRWVIDLLSRQPRRDHCRSILFIKLTEQGSTVLAYDAIERAVGLVGRNRVYILVFEENRAIVDVLAQIPSENVLTVRTASFGALLVSLTRRLLELRRMKIQACIDLEFFSRTTAVLTWLCGAQQRVGFYSRKRGAFHGDLFTHRVEFDPTLHTAAGFRLLAVALEKSFPRQRFGAAPSGLNRLPRYEPPPPMRARMKTLVNSLGAVEGEPIFLLNANAGDLLPQRRWPSGNYVALAKRLLDAWPEALVIFTGSISEAGATCQLAAMTAEPRCHSLAGQTSLPELLTLCLMADVLVTNDSGPAHFAALTDIEVVTLFGPETPALFAAQTPRNHVIWRRTPCSPCVNAFNQRQTFCRNNICLQNISVDEVYLKVSKICRRKSLLSHA